MQLASQFRAIVADRGVWGALRMLLPNAITPIPKQDAVAEASEQTALSIVARQGEGSVLVSAGLIDMTGFDLDEEETISASADSAG